MFSKLSDNLSTILNKIKGRGFLSEDDINHTTREIRVALLEADVSLSVVKDFIESVKKKASNTNVLKNVMPGNIIVKIVYDELVHILGGNRETNGPGITELNLRMPTIMLVGLQGTGKTTTAAKLASLLSNKHKKRVLLASTDVHRPAAQLQLQQLSEKVKIDSLPIIANQTPEEICMRAMESVKHGDYNVLIMDTAGRLQTDDKLMKELEHIKSIISPSEIILVTDAMVGQESVNIAKAFHSQLGVSSIILTRLDGDARGGAALSMKMGTGCPIVFVGTGEKMDALEPFYPERTASRILGMGDVVTLVEKAASTVSTDQAKNIMQRIQQGKFNMDDLLESMQSIKKMGNIKSILSMIPGLGAIKNLNSNQVMDENMICIFEAIICSMTVKEKRNPLILNSSRKKRIARGSGRSIEEVNRLIKQFHKMNTMMKQMAKVYNNKNGRPNMDLLRNIMQL